MYVSNKLQSRDPQKVSHKIHKFVKYFRNQVVQKSFNNNILLGLTFYQKLAKKLEELLGYPEKRFLRIVMDQQKRRQLILTKI